MITPAINVRRRARDLSDADVRRVIVAALVDEEGLMTGVKPRPQRTILSDAL